MPTRMLPAAVVALALACGNAVSVRAQSTGAPDSVLIRGSVLDDDTGAPIELATVEVLLPSGAVLATVNTMPDGQFVVIVGRGAIELVVRRIPYLAQRRSIAASEMLTDTVSLTLRLVPLQTDLKRRVAELQKPTQVTPCRPDDSTAASIATHLRDLVADEADLALLKLSSLHLAPVEHVIDRERCRAATTAMAEAHGTTPEGLQVHLFRLGNKGWAAFEASFISGHYWYLYILDADLVRVREVIAF